MGSGGVWPLLPAGDRHEDEEEEVASRARPGEEPPPVPWRGKPRGDFGSFAFFYYYFLNFSVENDSLWAKVLWQGLVVGGSRVPGTLCWLGSAREGGGGLYPVASLVRCCLSLPGASGAPSEDGNPTGASEALLEWDVDKPFLPPHCTQIKPEFDSSRYGWPGSDEGVPVCKGIKLEYNNVCAVTIFL